MIIKGLNSAGISEAVENFEVIYEQKANSKSKKPVQGINIDIGIVDLYTVTRSFVTAKTFSFLKLNFLLLPGFNAYFVPGQKRRLCI